jgi:transcriptional regulator with XRE-family HTH domain
MADQILNESIGARFRRLRIERGLSQRALAEKGIGYAYISRVERDERVPSVKALRRLAGKLGVTAEYLETGVDVAPGESRELRLGEAELALRLDGDVEAAEVTLREVLADALEAGDARDAARARIGLGLTASHRGEPLKAIALLEQAVAEDWVTPLTSPNAFVTLSYAYLGARRLDDAIAVLRHALAELRCSATVERPTIVRFATYLSYALSDAGDLEGARAALDEALDHSAGEDDAYTRVRLYWSNARLASLDGDNDLARLSINRAIAVLETTEDTSYLARAHLLAAEISLLEDDLDGARRHLVDAEPLIGPTSELVDRAWLRTQQALVAARDGDAAEAIDLATEAEELLAVDDDQNIRGWGRWALGEALAAAGAEGAARKAFRQASELIPPGSRYAEPFVAAWAKLFPADVDVR